MDWDILRITDCIVGERVKPLMLTLLNDLHLALTYREYFPIDLYSIWFLIIQYNGNVARSFLITEWWNFFMCNRSNPIRKQFWMLCNRLAFESAQLRSTLWRHVRIVFFSSDLSVVSRMAVVTLITIKFMAIIIVRA